MYGLSEQFLVKKRYRQLSIINKVSLLSRYTTEFIRIERFMTPVEYRCEKRRFAEEAIYRSIFRYTLAFGPATARQSSTTKQRDRINHHNAAPRNSYQITRNYSSITTKLSTLIYTTSIASPATTAN